MKIYGITTDIDLEALDNLREDEVFKMIFKLQRIIGFVDNKYYFDKYELDEKQLEMANYNLDYLIYYTRKFGVKFNTLPKEGRRIARSDDYNKWYSFWYCTYADMHGEKAFAKDLSYLADTWNTQPKKHIKDIRKLF